MSELGGVSLLQCPKCTALIEVDSKFCRNCGQSLEQVESPSTSGDQPAAGSEQPEVPFTVSGELVPARHRHSIPVSKWSMPILGGVGVIAVIAAAVAFGWIHAQTPETTTEIAPIVRPPAAHPAAPAIVEPPPLQKWLGRRQASWAADGSKTITFELQANDDVAVWMSRVRPQLVVRCVSRTTEVFVSLGSAASLEQQTGSHTVQLQIDDDPPVRQVWTDSTTSHELFAPDGLTLTRRLSDAHRMRFGFTPYNAQPVVADFSVQGFDELAPIVAKTCGWTIDEPVQYDYPRSARRK